MVEIINPKQNNSEDKELTSREMEAIQASLDKQYKPISPQDVGADLADAKKAAASEQVGPKFDQLQPVDPGEKPGVEAASQRPAVSEQKAPENNFVAQEIPRESVGSIYGVDQPEEEPAKAAPAESPAAPELKAEGEKTPEPVKAEGEPKPEKTGDSLERLNQIREEYARSLFNKENKSKEEWKKESFFNRVFIKPEVTQKAIRESLKDYDKIIDIKKAELKEALSDYRKELLDSKENELKSAGFKPDSSEFKAAMDKYAQEVAQLTAVKEKIAIYNRLHDIEAEKAGELGEKAKELVLKTGNWYRKLPLSQKLLYSGLLLAGGAGAGALLGATVGGLAGGLAFANAIRRGFIAAGTGVGVEAMVQKRQENKDIKNLNEKFSDDLLKIMREQGDKLDDEMFRMLGEAKSQERRRYVLAGAAMAGVLLAPKIVGFFRDYVALPTNWKWPSFGFENKPPAGGGTGYSENVKQVVNGTPLQPKMPDGIRSNAFRLPIGARGPEGAIIDHLKANPETAKLYGWDGKGDVKDWAGKKAHELWLNSAKAELAKPETLAQLKKLGYSADAEGYAKMMHRIGKGFVNLEPGKMGLADTDFMKAAADHTVENAGGPGKAPNPIDIHPGADAPDHAPDAAAATSDAAKALEENYKKVFENPGLGFKQIEKVSMDDLQSYIPTFVNSGMSNTELNNFFLERQANGFKYADTFSEFQSYVKLMDIFRTAAKVFPNLIPENADKMAFGEFMKEMVKNGVLKFENNLPVANFKM